MKIVDVAYYQFYIFYKTVLRIRDSHFAAMLGMSELVVFPILLAVFFILAINFKYVMPAYLFLGLDAILILPFHHYFIRKKRGELIVGKAPLLFGNRLLSLCFSWLVHIIFFFLLLGLFKYSCLFNFGMNINERI